MSPGNAGCQQGGGGHEARPAVTRDRERERGGRKGGKVGGKRGGEGVLHPPDMCAWLHEMGGPLFAPNSERRFPWYPSLTARLNPVRQ